MQFILTILLLKPKNTMAFSLINYFDNERKSGNSQTNMQETVMKTLGISLRTMQNNVHEKKA